VCVRRQCVTDSLRATRTARLANQSLRPADVERLQVPCAISLTLTDPMCARVRVQAELATLERAVKALADDRARSEAAAHEVRACARVMSAHSVSLCYVVDEERC
jgi:hypothetical protein